MVNSDYNEGSEIRSLSEVLIAGGGPAGLTTAIYLIAEGVNVTVIEEHKRIGRPQHCAGIVSKQTYDAYSRLCHSSDGLVVNEIKGLCIGLIPTSETVGYKSKTMKALVLHRTLLEERLAESLLSRGGIIKTGVCATSVGYDGVIVTKTGTIRGDLVVDARGVSGLLTRGVPRELYLPSLQMEMKVSGMDRESIEVWIDKRILGEFFFWVCPLDESTVRVGCAGRDLPLLRVLEWFIRRRFGVIESPIRWMGGAILTSGSLEPLQAGRLLFIGDTAGQTKPLTGGGLSYIQLASKLLSSAVSSGKLSSYSAMWNRLMKGEIRAQLLIRRAFEGMTNRDLSLALKLMDRADVLGTIVERGDMDRALSILRTVGNKPLLGLILPALVRGLVGGLLGQSLNLNRSTTTT